MELKKLFRDNRWMSLYMAGLGVVMFINPNAFIFLISIFAISVLCIFIYTRSYIIEGEDILADAFISCSVLVVLPCIYGMTLHTNNHIITVLTIMNISGPMYYRSIQRNKFNKFLTYSIYFVSFTALYMCKVTFGSVVAGKITLLANVVLCIYNFSIIAYKVDNHTDEINTLVHDCSFVFLANILFAFLFASPSVINKVKNTHVELYLLTMYIYYIYATRIKDKVVMSHSTLYESNVRLNKNRQKLDKLNMAIKQDLVIQEKLNEYILQRKELLEKALDTMPDAWAIMERDLSISYYNKKYEAEFVDESGKDKVFLDVIRESKKVFDKLGAKISISDKKVDIYDKKFLLNVNHDKHHDNYLISLNDITAESIMDKKLKEINEDYEKIVMNIPCPIAIRTTGEDDEKNVLMQVNDSFIKSFGISEEELLKYTIKEYIDKFELRIFDSNKFDVVDIHDIEARKFIEDSKEKRGIIDYSIVDSYGNRRIEEVRLADYYIENNIFELLTFKDISEEIDILSEINNRSITYEKILDAIPEAIFLENISTSRVIYTNKAFVDLFGIEDDTSGEVTQKYRNILVKKYINNLKIGNQGKYINIVNEKNTIKEVELVSRKIYFGQRECKVRIIRDLSVQRKSEKMQKSLFKQRAYDQMKMEFYANISHELKTPLNNIYSSSQLIEKLFEGGKIKESTDVLDNHLRITKQNMFRLMKLIDNIINISQIKSEIYMVNIEKFNVVEAVEDIVASTDAYYKSNNIDLVFDTNEEVIMVELDPESIERIVLNLLSNSIKFTQPGGKITVGVYKNGKNVELMVKDTGVGIKGEKLKEIFGRFNQIEDSGVSNEFGSGIGLFLTKSLVDAQKGKIDIESEINEGTEITITFSVMDSE